MSETDRKEILVVDNDMNVLKKVESVLHKEPFNVHLATDGALAINRALASPPELMVSAVEMPLLDGFKLCQLLRTNPLTSDIPFIFFTTKDTNPHHLGKYLRPFDEFLLKPFKEDELVRRIENIFSRMEKVQGVSGEEQQALLGTLTEITLMDLLQMLRMNRRSGLLILDNENRRGSIYIKEGEVINAEYGKFKGEKAFFRALEWERGKFEFRPQTTSTDVLIKRPGENLILEGLRQLDECNKIKQSDFSQGTKLKLDKRFQGPEEKLRPVTRDILKLLEYFSSLDDLLDQSTFLDLEICQTVQSLIKKGIVSRTSAADTGASIAESPLLSLEEALKLSYHLGVGREQETQLWSGKVIAFAEEFSVLQRYLEGLSRLSEFKIDAGMVLGPASSPVPLGSTGEVQIMEGTNINLYCFPSAPQYHPLWESLSLGSIGALILTSDFTAFPAPARFCDEQLHIPFLISGPGIGTSEPPAGDEKRWKPSVPWKAVAYNERDELSQREAFRELLLLVLAQ